MHWKTDIIERLESAYASGDRAIAATDLMHADEAYYRYGTVRGRLQRDKAILLGPRTDDGRAGYDLLVPLLMDNGRSLMIDAGWVSDLWQDDFEERLAALPQEEMSLRGLVRRPDWSRFTSNNSPSRDMWFRADVEQIAAAKQIGGVYPGLVLYADRTDPPLHDIKPHEAGWLPRNKHLQYAIFWYVMAAALAGVFIATRLKRRNHL